MILSVCFRVVFADEAVREFRVMNRGLRDIDVRAIAVSRDNPDLAFAGSARAIYRTVNGGRDWQVVLNLRGSNRSVNHLSFDRRNGDLVYAATDDGLYRLVDGSSLAWERVFRGIGEQENTCAFALAEDGLILLGTSAGLFISRDRGISWGKAGGKLGLSYISSLDKQGDNLFAATQDSLFVSRDIGLSWDRVFNLSADDAGGSDEEDDLGAGDYSSPNIRIRYVFVEKSTADRVYLVTDRGVLFSNDRGETFSAVSSAGLANKDVDLLFVSEGDVYSAGRGGIFRLPKDGDYWQNLYKGLSTQDVRFALADDVGRLWLATDKGVFCSRAAFASRNNVDLREIRKLRFWFKDEPSIGEVQAAAIRYAEVHPNKIRAWRQQARLKALMPALTLDFDKTVTTALGASYDRTQIGPQDWGVNLKWDLADMIYSADQTSIDVRSRLMVQLRDDILNEVTRFYFERRRLQAELLLSPPKEAKEIMDKNLRIDELSASIDALTGGYFSRRLAESDPGAQTRG